MAVKGSGVVAKTIDPPMEDRISSSPINPRSGAAKKTQTKYPVKTGMKDQTDASKLRGAVPTMATNGRPTADGYTFGPDASSANPLDPEPKDKNLRRQPSVLKSSWGMKDANGNGVDNDLGKGILDEASRLGKGPSPA